MWEYFQAGGLMMWPLLACSILAFAIILERSWFWHSLGLKKDISQANKLLRTASEGKSDMQKPKGVLSSMLYAGLSVKKENCSKVMEVMALEIMTAMQKRMNILDTIITAAPMLGIMGTVLGIITSFDMLGVAGTSDPKIVISGIAQALITTLTGLGIAVFTLFPYNYFNNRIDQAHDILEMYGSRLEIALNIPPRA